MIAVEQLTKKYSSGRGIFDVSFKVDEGEVFGFLGPNGAGKSTTIRHLMGFLRPDQGWAQIDGIRCWEHSAKVQAHVGYLPGEMGFLEDMTGLEFLDLMAGMRKRRNFEPRARLLERFELDAKTPIRKMSKGTKQKVGIVAAFMHEPRVLILDEPTSGLDPLMQQRFLELVEEEKQRGTTIFMSSHIFSEVERICDRVGILKDGRLVALQDINSLREMQRKVFRVTTADGLNGDELNIPGCRVVGTHGNEVDIEVRGNYNGFIGALSTRDIQALDMRPLDLEQIFMHFYPGKEAH